MYDATKWEDLSEPEQAAFLSVKNNNGNYNTEADWKGKEIFEWDIINNGYTKLLVVFYQGAFCVTHMPNAYWPLGWDAKDEDDELMIVVDNDYLSRTIVIGNIHDNPELIKL